MFAIIHDGIVTVKNKQGESFHTQASAKPSHGYVWVQYFDKEEITDSLPVLEHNKMYVVELRNGFIVAEFDADEFAFFIGASWSVNEVKGFAPIPQMIEI